MTAAVGTVTSGACGRVGSKVNEQVAEVAESEFWVAVTLHLNWVATPPELVLSQASVTVYGVLPEPDATLDSVPPVFTAVLLALYTLNASDSVLPSGSETVAYSLTAASPTIEPEQDVVGDVCSALGTFGLWS